MVEIIQGFVEKRRGIDFRGSDGLVVGFGVCLVGWDGVKI